MVHLPPDSHILASYANSNLAWWKALAELVDNSLDAGAGEVTIDINGRELTVSDDGAGCENITTVFRLGDHKKRRSSKRSLGRYGIGAKDAWLSCSDTMEVITRRGKVETSMKVNYQEWMNNNWNAPDPESHPTDKPSGTTINLLLRKGKNAPNDDAFKMLAFAFTPAIRNATRINKSIKGEKTALRPVEMPMRNDVVQAEFDIDGKSVKIDIGILPDGVKFERGPFWLIYGHRIIEATSLGAGQYSVRRVAGTITIGDGWALSKNKDDLSENQDRLADAIFARIEHVLKKADQLAETMESAALRGELQQILNSAFGEANKAKEKRCTGESIGSIKPKSTGRERLKAAKTQDGSGSVLLPSKTGRKGGYILDWCEEDEPVLGRFDRSGMRVALNLNNGFISQAKATSNHMALALSALSLIADYCCHTDEKQNKLMRFQCTDFAEAIGVLVKDFKDCSEGKKDAKSAV